MESDKTICEKCNNILFRYSIYDISKQDYFIGWVCFGCLEHLEGYSKNLLETYNYKIKRFEQLKEKIENGKVQM